ncbi:MAG: hypothetical protein R3C19_14255 [Planctomycetaceae bacterium]
MNHWNLFCLAAVVFQPAMFVVSQPAMFVVSQEVADPAASGEREPEAATLSEPDSVPSDREASNTAAADDPGSSDATIDAATEHADSQTSPDSKAAKEGDAVGVTDGRIDLRKADESVRARYRNVNGEWWYQLKSGRWVYWRSGKWQDFDPATYVSPTGSNPASMTQGTTILQNSTVLPNSGTLPGNFGASRIPYSVVPPNQALGFGGTGFGSSRAGYNGAFPYGTNVLQYSSPATIRRFGGFDYGGVGQGVRRLGGYGGFSGGLQPYGPASTGFGRSYDPGAGGFGDRRGGQ